MEEYQRNNKRQADSLSNDLYIKRIKNDEIHNEIKAICSIIPVTEEKASEALEIYFDSPNRLNLALESCIENNKSIGNSDTSEILSTPDAIIDVKEDEKEFFGEIYNNENIYELVDSVISIFPDVDPIYVWNQLEELHNSPNKAETLCVHMMDLNGKYPLLKEREEMEKLKEKKISNSTLTVDDFIKMFPKPKEIFLGTKRPELNYNYVSASITCLFNNFNMLQANYIRNIFAKMHQNYTLTYDELTKQINTGKDVEHRIKAKRNKIKEDMQCEFLHHELFYVQNRKKIDNYEEEKKEELKARICYARANNLLRTCECCYDEEVLIDEMVECTDGHLFCKLCLRKTVEVGVGEGHFKFNCFDGQCKEYFSYPVIQSVVDPKIFSNMLKLLLEDDLRMANIPDLVSCPFCSFSVIMPDANNNLFRCLNPDCMKETCRLCKEPNHIPLRCNEVEKSLETKMRTFIENHMADAMLRTCYNCKRKFYKVEGCNHMTCKCGATMCYICRQPLNNHRNQDGRCDSYTDIDTLHKKEKSTDCDSALIPLLCVHG